MGGRDGLGDVFEESDLRSGLRDGGQVLGAFIIARGEEEFVVYLRCNWIRGRGFRIIRTWRGSSGDRKFRNLQSAWGFVRKFNFLGRVTVYPVGDPELRQFVGVAPQDLGGIGPLWLVPLPGAVLSSRQAQRSLLLRLSTRLHLETLARAQNLDAGSPIDQSRYLGRRWS